MKRAAQSEMARHSCCPARNCGVCRILCALRSRRGRIARVLRTAHAAPLTGFKRQSPRTAFCVLAEIARRLVRSYEEDTAEPHPLKFFLRGSHYRLLGFLPAKRTFSAPRTPESIFSALMLMAATSFRAPLRRPGVAARWPSGRGNHIAHRFVHRCGRGLLRWLDDSLLMRLAELFLALPWLYLLFAIRAFLPLAVSPLKSLLS